MAEWVRVCNVGDIGVDDVYGFTHAGRHYAVYRLEDGVFATDGHCTHEVQDLADGFVLDDVIECPLHGGSFDIRTGKALTPPVCVDLATYPAKVVDGDIFIAV